MINWIKNLFKKKEEPIVPLSPNNWTISRTNNRVLYKIPVGDISKEDAEKQLKQLISNYQTPMTFPTNYWFPSPGETKIEKIERILNKINEKYSL
jgi:hypothetical protein